MANIGILTFHHGYNFGGFAQVYALKEVTKSFGHNVEVINYYNKNHIFKKHIALLSKNLYKTWINFKKAKTFLECHKYLDTSRFVTKDNISKLKYDAVLFGSDEIWNYKNPFFGTDYTYFGKKINTSKKISYACSFGSVNSSFRLSKELVRNLQAFSNISVRDANSYKTIKENIGISSEICLDPAFLFDFNSVLKEPKESFKYIVVYSSASLSNGFISEIKKYAKKRELNIISLGYWHDWCDKNIINISPFEWIGYLKQANYIFTTMFHGTIFSILAKKRFMTEITAYRSNKFDPMVKKLNIENRIHQKDGKNISIKEEQLNYESIFNTINKEKEKSINYLKSSI